MADATTNPTPNPIVLEALPEDPAKEMMKLLVQRTLMMLKSSDLTPAFMEFTRKLLQDNAVTLASVKRGDFGEVYKRAAEEFPFPQPTTQAN